MLRLSKEFFPEAVEKEILQEERDNAYNALNLVEKYGGASTKFILEVLKKIGNIDPNLIEDKIAEVIFDNNEQFSLTLPGKFCGIQRYNVISPELNSPYGKIIEVIGAPKVGKLFLIWEAIEYNNYNYKGFYVTLDPRRLGDFIDNLLLSIYSLFMTKQKAIALIKKGDPVNFSGYKLEVENPIIFIIKNANLITPKYLKLINLHINELKRNNALSKIGIIFISNKSVSEYVGTNTTIVAPPWTSCEIHKLIEYNTIKINDENINEYFYYLWYFSKGHPLLALSLATKYNDLPKLITLLGKFSSDDEVELEKEIISMLYNDILITPDQKNFVQRLSLLTENADINILDLIRNEIAPQINATAPHLVKEIGPVILDGDLKEGLKVNLLFSDFSKKMISPSEIEQVYRIIVRILLMVNADSDERERYQNI